MPAQARKPSDWDWVFILDHVDGTPNRSLGELAREREEDPIETMLHIGIEQDLETIYQVPLANEYQDTVLEIMREPRSLVTFSDGGAHVSQIMDCSLQTHVLTHLGAQYRRTDPRAGREAADLGYGLSLGAARARAAAPRLQGRHHHLRPRNGRTAPPRGGLRPARTAAPAAAEGGRLPLLDRQRRRHDARRRADRW